jgi:hypothetical protein
MTQRFGRKEPSTLIPRSETDLLTSSIRSHGISSLVSQSISGSPPVHGGAGATNGVPECLAAYLPNEILKILRRKPESCCTTCDDGTPPHSDVMLRWTAKPEGSKQGWPMPNT